MTPPSAPTPPSPPPPPPTNYRNLPANRPIMYCRDGYYENHLFDGRLMKDDLIDRWPTEDIEDLRYVETKDARNLAESHVFKKIFN